MVYITNNMKHLYTRALGISNPADKYFVAENAVTNDKL